MKISDRTQTGEWIAVHVRHPTAATLKALHQAVLAALKEHRAIVRWTAKNGQFYAATEKP